MGFAVGFGMVSTTVADVVLIAGGDFDRPGRIGWAAVLTVPAALAVASLEDRPVLLFPAALLSLGLSVTLFSGLPLLFLPGVAYFVAFLRRADVDTMSTRAVIAIGAPIALTALATGLAFAGPHPEMCVTTGNTTSCGSLVAGGSSVRLALVIALAVLAVVTGMVAAEPARATER